jgi:hypothetical protein
MGNARAVLLGSTRRSKLITVEKPKACESCHGCGVVQDGPAPALCAGCNGSGEHGTESVQVLVKQPTMGGRRRILEAGKFQGSEMGDPTSGQIEAVIVSAHYPDSGKPMFEATDREALLEQPAGGWLDAMAAEAMAMVSPAAGVAGGAGPSTAASDANAGGSSSSPKT